MNVLFFSPFAAVWKHAEPEIDIALELIKHKHEVTFLRCDSDFKNFCLAMSAYGVNFSSDPQEKLEICRRCKRSRLFVQQDLNLRSIKLNDFGMMTSEDRLLAASVDSENWDSFTYMGIPVGKYASYEFLIHHKLIDRNIPQDLLSEYRSALEYSIYVARVGREILVSGEYDKVIVYNRYYSVNRVFCRIAEDLGIPTFSLQASGPADSVYSKFSFVRDDLQNMSIPESEQWREFASSSLSLNQITSVARHYEGLLGSKNQWVFSSAARKISRKSLRSKLGIPPDSKVLLLATSSQDELAALFLADVIPGDSEFNQASIFTSQVQWIRKVIDFLEQQEDVFLIVRVHPREFINYSGKGIASNAQELLELLKVNSSPNIYINTPTDDLSIYNLMSITDLLLTGYSSVGAEFAALGVPVLSHYFHGVGYPRDLVTFSRSPQDYFQALEKLIQLNNRTVSVLGFRWFSFRYETMVRGYDSNGFSKYAKFLALWRRPKIKFGLRFPKFLSRFLIWRYMSKDSLVSPFLRVLNAEVGGFEDVKSPSREVGNLDQEYEQINIEINKIWRKLSDE